MVFWVLLSMLSFLLDLVATFGLPHSESDLGILLLRQQVRILQRRVTAAPRISRGEKLLLLSEGL